MLLPALLCRQGSSKELFLREIGVVTKGESVCQNWKPDRV